MEIYDFNVKLGNGKEISMSDYKGKVLLIVNTASKCGFTYQYGELQKLYEQYNKKGFEILPFPCNQFMNQEPKSNDEIAEFCKINFGLSFPLFAKIDVNGKNADPLFVYLRKKTSGLFSDSIKWNFTKFLIDRNGNIIGRFKPSMSPLKLKDKIEALLS
ncbi:MAG TPA: glutathione peroxidase [Spirochaetota bacterium]|nr:glutathione peroxidase [Spirochaetota bacterium]